jgi:hypothetical protein
MTMLSTKGSGSSGDSGYASSGKNNESMSLPADTSSSDDLPF